MIDASKMTFEEWLAAKAEEDKRITHNAETVKDHRLYDLEMAVLKVCFDKKLSFMNLYFIPPDLDKGAVGMYGAHRLMVLKPFWEEHGLDDEAIAMMFHECCHAWCDLKGIKGTEGKYHLQAFAQVCQEHGGTCAFGGQDVGFNDARPTADTLERIKKELRI